MIFTFRLVPPQYGAVYGQRLAISLEGSNGVHLITIGYTLRTFSVGGAIVGHLKEFKIPEKYSSKWMWDTIQQIRVPLSVLHDSNFPPEGLTGSRVIRKSTLPIDRLTGGEFHLPFIMLATPTTTTSTSWTNVGGIVVYDPNMWGDVKSLVFDVTGIC